MLQFLPDLCKKNYTIYHCLCFLFGLEFFLWVWFGLVCASVLCFVLVFSPHFFLSWIVRKQSLPFGLLSIGDQSQGKEISIEFCFVGFLLHMELHLTSTLLFSEDIYLSRTS